MAWRSIPLLGSIPYRDVKLQSVGLDITRCNLSAVKSDCIPDYRQSEARTAQSARTPLVNPEKTLEYMLHSIVGHTDSVVAERETMPPVTLAAICNLDFSP